MEQWNDSNIDDIIAVKELYAVDKTIEKCGVANGSHVIAIYDNLCPITKHQTLSRDNINVCYVLAKRRSGSRQISKMWNEIWPKWEERDMVTVVTISRSLASGSQRT
jgi:hypothetical protein